MPPSPGADAPSTQLNHHPPPARANATDVLARAVQDLSLADTAEEVQRVVRSAARRLVDAEGATFVLRDGDRCSYVDEDAIAPLWKGQSFPLEVCISGWAMLNREQAMIGDIYTDDRIPHDAYRPTFVKSLLMTPIRRSDPIGAIGMYWAHPHQPTRREAGLAAALADSTAVALQHVATLGHLERERKRAETDALTGALNRHGWDALTQRRFMSGAGPWALAILDLDGLKALNDSGGHETGDEALQGMAAAWQALVRPVDVFARLGGDEFGLLLDRCSPSDALHVLERMLDAARPWGGVSIGLATRVAGQSPAGLAKQADEALYEAKRAGGGRIALSSGEPNGAHRAAWPVDRAG